MSQQWHLIRFPSHVALSLNLSLALSLLVLEAGLDLVHEIRRLVQLLRFGLRQDLTHNMTNSVGAQDAGQRQKDLLVHSVFALEENRMLEVVRIKSMTILNSFVAAFDYLT